ncbi:hypothetical protein [Pseudonocardia sp. NPDC049635]|uniref:hypothetical protein n=1 Tax=Pseudonocardia sp. NPDC049635 TaxID=3155506 RepID=UPI003401D3B4
MIGALLSHEVRSTRRTLGTTIGVALGVGALSLVVVALRIPVLGELGFALAVAVVTLITPLVLVVLAEHYWRTMYGREGYFTMTVPVRGSTLFAVKVLHGIAVTVGALALTVGGAGAVVAVSASARGVGVAAAFQELSDGIGTVGAATVWFLAGCVLVQSVFTVVAGAAVMSIGAESRFNHLGFGAPVLGGVALYLVMQVLGLAAMLFVPFGLRITGPDAGTFVAQGMLADFMQALRDPVGQNDPSVVGLGIVPLAVVATGVLAWWGAGSVERRTSLR